MQNQARSEHEAGVGVYRNLRLSRPKSNLGIKRVVPFLGERGLSGNLNPEKRE